MSSICMPTKQVTCEPLPIVMSKCVGLDWLSNRLTNKWLAGPRWAQWLLMFHVNVHVKGDTCFGHALFKQQVLNYCKTCKEITSNIVGWCCEDKCCLLAIKLCKHNTIFLDRYNEQFYHTTAALSEVVKGQKKQVSVFTAHKAEDAGMQTQWKETVYTSVKNSRDVKKLPGFLNFLSKHRATLEVHSENSAVKSRLNLVSCVVLI